MRTPARPWSLLALLFWLHPAIALDPLPYNPTRLLIAPNSTFLYLFEPADTQTVLRVVDIQNTFATNALSPTTLAGKLPFLKDDELVPYIPIVEPSGNITVLAGTCSDGASKTEVWTFHPDLANGDGNGTWTSHSTSADESDTGTTLSGTNFLGNAVSFAADVGSSEADLDYYTFGGMCPFSNSTADTWVSAANYSNAMLSLTPNGDGYDIAAAANRAPPVAEAGFTMTGLTPTFSVKTSSGNQTQQQDFLLLGGHTQEAFLNMSQIALYSLPQESWTFLSVQQPSSAKTDLAARQDTTSIEPRSGHTAVLSEDGSQVVVFGGWVGDVSTPAKPQLAILHLGSEYGGNEAEAWSWTIPSQESTGLASGAGVYGHGATLLPGGVMMIAGGYSIPAASSKRNVKRAASDTVYLFNASTGASIDNYNPPAYVAQFPSAKASSNGPLSKTSQQTGLGVGLGVGVVVLLVLIFFYFWYARRLRRIREERERDLLTHSSDGSYAAAHEQPFLGSGGIDGRGGDSWAMADDPNNPDGMTQAGSTGLFVNALSPTRGLRKALISKPYNYEQAPRYDESRTNRGSGGIHPILERQDEDDTGHDDHVFATPLPIQRLYQAERGYETSPERRQRELQAILNRSAPQNPFADPPPNPLGSHPVSPVSPTREDTVRRMTIQDGRGNSPTRRPLTTETEGSMNWTITDGMAEYSENSGSTGRSSPTRLDDRTSSTLSEQSQRSAMSSNSITRTMSTRTGKLLAAAMAKDSGIGSFGEPSPGEERSNTMSSSGGRRSPFRLYNTARMPTYDVKGSMHNPAKSTDSFKTAKSSFAHLQTEGEALLGGRPKDDPYHRALAAHQSTAGGGMSHLRDDDIPAAPARRKQGWVGSLKRALTAMSTDRTFSFTGGSEILTSLADEARTSSSSPTRQHRTTEDDGMSPRRTVSDGGALLRQKRGEKDWSEDNKTAYRRYRDDPDPGDWGEPSRPAGGDGEDEWDVEGEGGKRDVQVMFTVPKARLRVVNADVDRASLRSASDGAISRSESLKSLRAKRSRTDWERVPLPKTAEEHADEIFGTAGKKKEV